MATRIYSVNVKNKSLKKCGEITTTIELGRRFYGLVCIFCNEICLELDAFASHVEQNHLMALFGATFPQEYDAEMVESNEFTLETNDGETEKCLELCLSREADVPTYIKRSYEQQNQNYQDPLEEPILKEPVLNIKEEEIYCDNGENLDYGCGSNFDEDKLESSATESEAECQLDYEDNENERELTLAIIEGYKNHRILWDTNEPMFRNRRQSQEALTKIANLVNERLGVHVDPKSIRDRIKKMRYTFRRELQNENLATTKGEMYTHIWYFHQLLFLNETITYKQRKKRGTKVLSKEKSALPLPNLSDAQNHQLIEIYKSFPCLWDQQHIGFRFKKQRKEALDEMLQSVKVKMSLNFTQDELQKKLYRIRYAVTEEKHRLLRCEQEGLDYSPVCRFYDDVNFLFDNVGPFKCSECLEVFNGADQYKIHKSQHDGSMPFRCPICDRGFMKVGNCTVHLRRHTRDYPFECKVCGKRYATTTDVNVHTRYHTGEKPYFCEVCGQSFRTWTFFDAHRRRHQKRPSHNCTICGKAFYENNKLTEHMKAHLNVRDKMCNICGKSFTSGKYLRQHKQIHAEKKKYACKICGKDFAQYAGLSGHMKSHGTTITGAAQEESQQH